MRHSAQLQAMQAQHGAFSCRFDLTKISEAVGQRLMAIYVDCELFVRCVCELGTVRSTMTIEQFKESWLACLKPHAPMANTHVSNTVDIWIPDSIESQRNGRSGSNDRKKASTLQQLVVPTVATANITNRPNGSTWMQSINHTLSHS